MFDGPPDNLPLATPIAPPPAPIAPPPPASVVLPRPTTAAPAPPPVAAAALPTAPAMPSLPADFEHHGSGLKTALMIVGAVVIIAVAGFIAYKLIIAPGSESPLPVAEEPETNEPVVTTPVEPEPEPEPEPAKDSDGDGLSDDEESSYGTDSRLADSDKDGLGDKEEVQVYGTDPLDPDTDNDSYLDGQEVAAGFNPNGDGKLFEVPR